MRVLISQRVDVLPQRSERRDALDQAWADTLSGMLGQRALVCPMPNRSQDVDEILKHWKPSLIVLSGGNDIGTAPERDSTESRLLECAAAWGIPVLAVCRGMQMVQHHLGGLIATIPGHVGQEHVVRATSSQVGPDQLWVNSFHGMGIAEGQLAAELVPLYSHIDGSIEAARHCTHPWLCVMWHPERRGKGMAAANTWIGQWLRAVQ